MSRKSYPALLKVQSLVSASYTETVCLLQIVNIRSVYSRALEEYNVSRKFVSKECYGTHLEKTKKVCQNIRGHYLNGSQSKR